MDKARRKKKTLDATDDDAIVIDDTAMQHKHAWGFGFRVWGFRV
jgi:hypothetical protein